MENARATLFDELFGLADAEHNRVQEVLDEDAQRMQTLLSDVSVPTTMELFTTPAHLLPPMSSLLDNFVDAILPAHSAPAPLPVSEEAAAPMAMDEPVTPRLDALDHVAKARDADISHLTAVFNQLMATPRLSEGEARPSSRSSKSKRKVSRSM